MPNNEDLVTGTPVTQKSVQDVIVYYNKNIELFKIIQRAVMVILTIAVLVVMCNVGREIRDLKTEMKNIAVITEKAMKIAEESRQDINRQIDEIQKDGIDLHFRLW